MTDPKAAKFIFQQGVRCLESRDFEAAIALFDDAVKLIPDDADAWTCRALALGHLKRYAESIESFERAVELKPDDLRIWLNRGIALSE
ncbi:MAG: tetratricopeptide repeat protein, partial [Microcoleus sp. T1-bin1]|nr:tetratricopeptide repeat protein [Microcoleus sp. T1-bin1]